MTFLPAPEILAAFTAACLLLVLTPGPDMTFFLGQTLTAGRARGMAAMLGACLGVVVHSMLAAFGLSALLVASATAFTVIKIAGAVYLVWLGIQAIRHGSALTLKKGDGRKAPISQVFLMGVGINLLNPKVVMFFLTFLPQFVSVSDPHAGSKLMFLGLYSIAFSIPICAAMIMMADRFTDTMRRSPRAMRIFDWLFAGLMGTFALRLLLARGN
jgi:threonine/homoserine/homoserine lactone efflux protein